MRLTMYLYLYTLKWYCWRNGLTFRWYDLKEDEKSVGILIIDKYDNSADYLSLVMSKKPARKPYQIYNRFRNLIRCKMIFKKKPIKRHNVDFGCYKFVTYC